MNMTRSLHASPFWLVALLSLAGYALLPLFFPLLPHYNVVPLSDVRMFIPSLGGGLGYALLFLALYGLYLLAYRYLSSKLSLWQLLLPAALFALPMLFTYPINATDVFRYFVRARVTTVYGESSLAVPPSAFPDDPYLPLAGEWADESSPYGPIWELFAAGITVLGGQRMLPALLLFKGLGIVAHLGGATLIWLSLKGMSPALRARRTLLWAWNPALLFMFVMDAHNDALMVFWLLLGFYLMQRRQRPIAGFLVAVLAPLTKLIGLLPLPFFFLASWQRLDRRADRWRFLVATGAGSLALTALTFLPFGSPLDLAIRLLREAAGGGGFSPAALLLLLAQRLDIPLAVDSLVTISTALFILLALWLLWLAWWGRAAVRGAADIFVAYLATALTFRIWYTIWPFPWLLLDHEGGQHRLAAGLTFLLTAQLAVIIYGHVRVSLLRGDQLVAHLLGVPLTFLLPLLVAFATRSIRRSGARQR